MDPKLAQILKRAKQVGERADELGKHSSELREGSVGRALSESISMSDTLIPMEQAVASGYNIPTQPVSQVKQTIDIESPEYVQSVSNSRLPDSIKKAMLSNPIPQPDIKSMMGGSSFDVTDDLIREVRGTSKPTYTPPVKTEEPKRSRMTEAYKKTSESQSTQSINDVQLRNMINEELSRMLPSIIEDYFDKRLISEQVQVKVGSTIFSGNLKPLPKTK